MSEITEYATRPVPDGKTVSGWQVGCVIIGIAITLPGLYSGGEIAQTLGLRRGVLALVFAAVVLSIMSIPTAIIGQQTRRTSYALITRVFGPVGGLVINAGFGLILLGWYAVTAELFGQTLRTGLRETMGLSLSEPVTIILSSALVILTTVYGFKAIDRLAIVAVPLLILCLAFVTGKILSTGFDVAPTELEAHDERFIWAVNAVIGAFIVNVVLMPDLSRYAKTTTDAIIASVMGNGVGSVVSTVLAMVPVLAFGQLDPMVYMLASGLGIGALVVLVGATWTTNAVNLYSTGLVTAEVVRKDRYKGIVLICGVAGTALALVGIADNLIDFLLLLGVFVPPVAGVYLMDYFKFGNSGNFPAQACVSAALAACYGLLHHLALLPPQLSSGITALDALILSAASYWAMLKFMPNRALV